jgi:WD40 repeat protein
MLCVGYDDSNIRVFNAQNFRMETIFKGHEDGVLDLIFDPNNKSLISTSSDKTFRIWQ